LLSSVILIAGRLYECRIRQAEIEKILFRNDFGEFYRRLKDVKDAYRRNPDLPAEIIEVELKKVNKAKEEEGMRIRDFHVFITPSNTCRVGKYVCWRGELRPVLGSK
jgi:hypothetical protein